ncbi:hypothetical protein L1987_59376 [Smallanthus sonchifolius]|uniref:Uncharacterized protein n=1 Tax=Smallanthus sonchifolius TaxID=185202 RepID=A0ACB9D5Y1_9ASTR|nr:hypothetical protein L1987_59376 [Smallanthus sonchifolius]
MEALCNKKFIIFLSYNNPCILSIHQWPRSDTCKTSSQQDPNVKLPFCTTSLQAAPASHCADLKGLGMMSIRLTRYNITDTRCYIKQLLKNNTKKLDPYVKSCLDDCFELYSDAISGIKQAMKSYSSKRFFDANVQISSVMDATTTCEDGFKERKSVVCYSTFNYEHSSE